MPGSNAECSRGRPLRWARQSARPLAVRLAGLLLLAIAAAPGGTERREEPINWPAVEREVEQLAYPQWFTDSLKWLRDVRYTHGMRTVSKGSFAVGEKMLFEVGWGPMNAGYGIISFEKNPSRPWYHLSAKGVTNNFVGAFFRVRDYLHCIADTAGFYPLFFEEHLREGRYKANRWVLYDHVKEMVYTGKKDKEKVEAPRFTHSILTLLYALRSRRFVPGDTMTIDCFVQSKNYKVFFKCHRREVIETPSGRFPCVLVEPRLEGEGRVFTKKDKIKLWFTDDEHAVPVLIKSKIAVGSISVRLAGYRGPAPMPPGVEDL